jgi:manganese/zinc/iron transport system permease protein
MGRLDILLTTLLVIAIVIGLQAVGVVLMSAMVVAPAAAARQWTDRLGVMVVLAAFFGALAGVTGTIISTTGQGLSTGPTIVLSASAIVLLSMLFAPNRGLVFRAVQRSFNRRQLRMDAVLGDLYQLASQHDEHNHPHSIEVLRAMNFGRGGVLRSLQELERRGWVYQEGETGWVLTEQGAHQARLQTEDRNTSNQKKVS